MILLDKFYDTWNNVKKEVAKKKRIFFKRGEIWFASIGKNIGNEEYGKNSNFERPILIIRKFNNNIFLAVPLTSQAKEGKFYEKLRSFSSIAILSQIRLLDAKRLLRKIGKINSDELRDIKLEISKMV